MSPSAAAPLVAAPLAAAPATSTPTISTAPLDHVSAQVFGEVTGLVSRGNGTHRISLTLNPAQLGEVRVVMTLRNGAVHVRMAAGHEARAALLDGSPELTRLLNHAGATESRIVVRSLPVDATTPAPPTPTGTTGTPLGAGTDQAPDRHAGTRADHQARDGFDHSSARSTRTGPTTAARTGSRSIQPVIGTRAAGVDLTM